MVSGKTMIIPNKADVHPTQRRFTSPEMPVPDGIFELSATAKRAHARPSTKPRQDMPWLRGEATGLPGLRTANLQRDHRWRLESSSFRAMEDVKVRAFQCGEYL